MAVVQLSVAVRNARADAFETTVGPSAIMKHFGGAMPANCAAADAGAPLATINLPSDYLTNPVNGTKSKSGTWQDPSADASGTATHWRVYDSTGTTCHGQGDITNNAGTGSLKVDNVVYVAGQPIDILSWSQSEGNA